MGCRHRFALTSTGPLSGKTTLAVYLQRHYGFVRASHAETLYREFVRVYNSQHLGAGLTVERLLSHKEAFRQDLQNFALAIGYSSPEMSREWTLKTLQEADPYWETRSVVFDSFRGEEQAAVMHDLGFVLVQLQIKESTRLARVGEAARYKKLLENMAAHPELELGIEHPDLVLPADGLVECLAWALTGEGVI